MNMKYFKTNSISTIDVPFTTTNMNQLLSSLQHNTHLEVLYIQNATYITDMQLKTLGEYLNMHIMAPK